MTHLPECASHPSNERLPDHYSNLHALTAIRCSPIVILRDTGGTKFRSQEHCPCSNAIVTVSRPVGGILSSSRRSLGGHPSERPTWGTLPLRRRASSPFPTLGLAPGGVYRAGGVTPAAGALLPHPFTLTCADPEGPPSAVSFLWHCPAGLPDWPLASTLLCGVPTFLDTIPQCGPCCGHLADSPSPLIARPTSWPSRSEQRSGHADRCCGPRVRAWMSSCGGR